MEMWPKEEGVITQCPASSGKFEMSTLLLEPLALLCPSAPPLPAPLDLPTPPSRPQHTWGSGILMALAGVGREQAGSGWAAGSQFPGETASPAPRGFQ